MNLFFSIEKIFLKISKKTYVKFFVALFFGLLTNGIALTSEIKNFDCMLFANGSKTLGESLDQGRYIIFLVQSFLNVNHLQVQVYFFNILISLIVVSISALIIDSILDIKNDVASLLFVSAFTSYVSITSMIFYSFACVLYSIAMLSTICGLKILLGVGVIKPSFIKYFISAALFIISLGIYQSYTVLAICIINILFIRDCLYSYDKNFKDILFKYLKIIATFFAAYLVNSLVIKLFIYIYDINIDTGIARAKEIFITHIFSNFSLTNVFEAYNDVLSLGFLPYGYAGLINNNFLLYKIYLLALVFSIVLMISIIYKYLIKKDTIDKIIKLAFAILSFLVLPISYGILEILFPNMVDGVQLTHLVFYIYLPLLMIDDMYSHNLLSEKKNIITSIISDVTIIYLLICILLYSYYGNRNIKSLYDMNAAVHKDLDMLVTRIQLVDGYSYILPIAFIGNKFALLHDFDREEFVGYRGVNMSNLASSEDLEFLLTNYTKFTYKKVNSNYKHIIADMDEVKQMATYPDAGSIKVVDEILVVKLPE